MTTNDPFEALGFPPERQEPPARFARDLLVQNGATLVGLVLNCWDRTGRFDSQEGYGYGDYKDGYAEEPGARAA